VGTPYTVYFGLNLFHTYMNTFASVDNNVRRKLDEMRKTWSQPVPGSQSTYPVFQKTVTSKIDEAMDSWARKQFQNRTPQIQSRGPVAQIQAQPYRGTPTPPQGQPAINQNYPGYQQYPNVNGATSLNNHTPAYGSSPNHTLQQIPTHYSQPPAPVPTMQTYLPPQQHVPQQNFQYGQPPYPTPVPATVDLDALNRDIDDLIVDAKIGSYSNPMDRASQQKLASLQSLKEIVDSGTLSSRDLGDVRKSISEQLAARSNQQPTPPPVPTPQPPLSYPYQQPPVLGPPPPSTTPSLFNSSNLADLLRATAPSSHPTPPPIHATPIPPPTGMQQNNQSHHAPPPAENPLIAQLRASGLLTTTPNPSNLGTPFTPPLNNTRLSMNNTTTTVSVKFTSSSFKTPRPDLLKYLFDARPNRCNTCGRRFTFDDAGREKKARHLDWHFKTKTRLVEAERRGIQRSWYVDEREWIKSREYDDDEGPTEENAGDGSTLPPSAAGAAKKKEVFIRVPNDAKMRNEPCPICQEKFESVWSEELQDFIWRDAMKVGNRVYHASCFQEATKDRENGATPVVGGSNNRARTSTPDSVLGKRKAEDITSRDGQGVNVKVKVEQLG
jgi:pre-mRNA cleavage complex 2 protein Pcf11